MNTVQTFDHYIQWESHQQRPRTIRSLVLSHFRRYPWPTTAWVVAHCIDRNGASVSSIMHKLYRANEIRSYYDQKTHRLIYHAWTYNFSET